MESINKDKKTKIIITGGLGFIFSHVAEHFMKKGFEVHIIDNESAGSNPKLILEWYKNFKGLFWYSNHDVSYQSVIPIIKNINPEYIIHAAAISDVDYSIKNPVKTIIANNNATINVFEAARDCKNLKKLLYVSTDEVYGECEHLKKEEDIIFPKNPYSLSKAFGSLLRITYDNTYPELRDKTCETRFCNVFGSRQDSRKVLPAIKKALNGGDPIKLHNDGEGYREYINVHLIPYIVELILDKGTRTYNITNNEGYTVNELIALAEKITGKKAPVIKGKRSGMDMKYQMSNERFCTEFGWTPHESFEDALKLYLTS